MMVFSVPPGYRRSKPPSRPKLDPFIGIIDRILEEDNRRPAKQRHTSKRIFERLRDEHGFAGGLTIVKDYVHERRLRQREVFVPLCHDPGHAQVDPRIKSEGMLWRGAGGDRRGGTEDPLLRV
jgi:transposase